MKIDLYQNDNFVKKTKVAQIITTAVRESKKSQVQIAAEMGVDANMITMWKQGRTPLSIVRAAPLAIALGIDAGDFVELVADEYHPEVMEVLSQYFDLCRR